MYYYDLMGKIGWNAAAGKLGTNCKFKPSPEKLPKKWLWLYTDNYWHALHYTVRCCIRVMKWFHFTAALRIQKNARNRAWCAHTRIGSPAWPHSRAFTNISLYPCVSSQFPFFYVRDGDVFFLTTILIAFNLLSTGNMGNLIHFKIWAVILL